jgi:hypothetical protein
MPCAAWQIVANQLLDLLNLSAVMPALATRLAQAA